MSEPNYEYSIKADGVLTDADGNELDQDGNPVETAPEEQEETEEQK